jgi:hypothetical protein
VSVGDDVRPGRTGDTRYPDSEFLGEPAAKVKHGWAVVVHVDGVVTNWGTYRWRWRAVRHGHRQRRYHPDPKQVEIRRV